MSIVKMKDGQAVPISVSDLNLIINMVRGSLENYAEFMNSEHVPDRRADSDIDLNEDPKGNLRLAAIKAFQDAAENIADKFTEAFKSNEEVDVEKLLKNVVPDIEKDLLKGRDNHDEYVKAFVERTGLGHMDEFLYNFMGYNEEKEFSKGDLFSDKKYKITANTLNNISKYGHFPGTEDLIDFDPASDDVFSLSARRQKNSSTLLLDKKAEALEEQVHATKNLIADLEKKRRQKAKLGMNLHEIDKELETARQALKTQQKDLNGATYGVIAFNHAARVSRMHAAKLMKKKEVTAEDLFAALSDINDAARMGQGEGGKLRAYNVHYFVDMVGRKSYGVDPGRLPLFMYRTLSQLADKMNDIKKIEDPLDRKSIAIELAAYTYQIAIIEHPFEDGNGRTCRLLADTILESFGLPPHIPDDTEQILPNQFGSVMKRNWEVAGWFFKGVKESSDQIKLDRQKQEKIKEKTKQSDLIRKKYYEDVSDRQVNMAVKNANEAHRISGRFIDSSQYEKFEKLLLAKAEVLSLINDAKKNNLETMNVNRLSRRTRNTLVTIVGLKEKTISNEARHCGTILKKLDEDIEKSVKAYVVYKYKDHSDNTVHEPQMKELSDTDRNKLNLMKKVLSPEKVEKMKKDYLASVNRKPQEILKAASLSI